MIGFIARELAFLRAAEFQRFPAAFSISLETKDMTLQLVQRDSFAAADPEEFKFIHLQRLDEASSYRSSPE
jgi:hypothetical protein